MTEQIEHMADEITVLLNTALTKLEESIDKQYTDAIAELEAERKDLEQERAAIDDAAADEHLEMVLPAQSRQARREADELILAGDFEGARVKLETMVRAGNAPYAMDRRRDAITARLGAIDKEERGIAKEIFEQWLSEEVEPTCRASEHGLFLTLLDGLRDFFYKFQDRTNTVISNNRERPLLNQTTFCRLTADERSLEWQAGTRWYGGRR